MGLIGKSNAQSAVLGLLTAALLQPAGLNAQQWELVKPQSKQVQGQRNEARAISSEAARSLQWTVVPNQHSSTAGASRSTEPSATVDSPTASSTNLNWQPLTAAEIEQKEQSVKNELAAAENRREQPLYPPKEQGDTYGGYRDLYRDNRWYPSITTIIPMGFGPQGFMAGIGISGSDCKPESKTCINYPNITTESLSEVGEAVFDTYIGFGDPQKAISVLVTNYSQGVYRATGGSGEKTYFGGNHTGLAISRNLWKGAAIKLGAEGWFRENSPQADLPKSAFGVISQHIPLKQSDPNTGEKGWFPDLYLTAGLGNGLFRPSDAVISAQIQSAKDAGCWYTPCSPEKTREAFLKGTEWGTLYPIGSVALAINEQANIITEWTGRNLNISLSLQPIAEWGWTITPGIGNLIQNSDYGKNVNIPACPECDMGSAITTRPIFYIRSMINIKF